MPFSFSSLVAAPLAFASAVLPALPAVNLPANLQQRLVAFLLRRALGGFLKGGLDDDRVQADVREGRFTLRGVEVDEQAINSLLSPTSPSSDDDPIPPAPLPLHFDSGTIGCITALVAWPLAKLDLVIDDVELVFRVVGSPPPADHAPPPSPPDPSSPAPAASLEDDEESALSMSIAHSFIAHELRPDEDAELRASLHLSPSESSASLDLPGAFSGALRDPAAGAGEDDAEKVETTVMARWVERVLARLEVRVSRVRVRVLWDAQDGDSGEHEAELRVEEVLCRGDAGAVGEGETATRSLEMTPPRVYLRPASAPPGTPRPAATETGYASGESEESEDSADEHDLLAMSQSIADLRTSFHSSASSSASSSPRDMFVSAAGGFSSVREEEDDPFQNPDGAEDEAFATPQSSPLRRDEFPLPHDPKTQDDWQLVVSLGPPPSASTAPEPRLAIYLSTTLPAAPTGETAPRQRPITTLHADIPHAWTLALHAEHRSAFGALAVQLTASSSAITPATSPSPPSKPSPTSLRIDLALRAANVVVLFPSSSPSPAAALHTLWSSGADPFVATPAALKAPHLRLRLDGLAFRSSPTSSSGAELTLGHLALSETHAHQGAWRTLPLLVDDAGLLRTLRDGAVDSADWLRPEQALYGRDWRVLPLGKKRKGAQPEPEEAREPAVRVRLVAGKTDVFLAPLHAFVDLGALGRLGPLLDAASDALPASLSAPASKHAPLAPSMLDDLSHASAAQPSLTITAPLLRIDVRVPAPRRQRFSANDPDALRGGRTVLDLLGAHAMLGNEPRVEVQRVAGYFAAPAAGASMAREFIRLASLADGADDGERAALPSLSLSSRGGTPLVALAVPLVHLVADKPAWDGLQLVADDAGQYFEELRRAGEGDEGEEGGREKMIGSRYFGGGGRGSETESTASGGTVKAWGGEGKTGGTKSTVKVLVTDVIVDLHLDSLVPTSAGAKRHLRLLASDLSGNVELFENGKDDLRATVGIMDVRFEDITKQTQGIPPVVVLARTMPRHLTAESAPLVHLVFSSSSEKESSLKESKVQLALTNFTYFVTADISWLEELGAFAKAPAGAFEHVVPNELTRLRIRLSSASLHVSAPTRASHVVLALSDARIRTDLMPDLPRTTFAVELNGVKGGMVDSEADVLSGAEVRGAEDAWAYWKSKGFAQILDLERASITARQGNGLILPDFELLVDGAKVELSLCADTISSLQAFVADLTSAPAFQAKPSKHAASSATRRLSTRKRSQDLLASVDPAAFERAPSLHDLPEILDDDVPANLDYLSEALNQTSIRPTGRRDSAGSLAKSEGELLSEVDGETIRMFAAKGLQIVDEWLAEARVDDADYSAPASKIRCRLTNADVTVHLHEGYDWATTRRAIEEEAKAVRRRLEKIRQLLASGQAPDASAEEASVLMFGSLQLGLPPGACDLSPKELLAAINEELDADARSDVVSTAASSWHTLPAGGPSSSSRRAPAPAVVGKGRRRLTRSKAFAIEINLRGVGASFDAYALTPASLAASISAGAAEQLASKIQADAQGFEIIDNIKTSTWRKFLTELRPNDGGIVRPTGAPMARVEMSTMRPVGRVADAQEEILMKVRFPRFPRPEMQLTLPHAQIKISPLRLYIDQDALDFLKAFGAFELPAAGKATAGEAQPAAQAKEPFFQRVEVLPVKIKLDYKPKRVDYNALRSGKTAELMNFFHFDGSEMTLRHLVVTGVSGTTTLSSLVQDIWTPDVKAHQLSDVISGIAPVRSVVNVGAGVANLVLLPIEQYRKDGRVVRGLQKGASAFARQTTLEAINVGAKLATGTQVILEQAEHVLGARFAAPISAETVPSPTTASGEWGEGDEGMSDEERREVRSRYAEQPADLRQGMHSAYKSLGENFKEAAQTILAVPMEVYERSGSEGPVRSVVRAVPVAVLKPMIGASGAVSKALLGLRNTLDPDAQAGELEDKYKPRAPSSGGGAGSA
ncbi:autophagy-related protein 2 [Rhodotorula kratochvilovae]